MSLISANIKWLRKFHHLTQGQLADALEVKRSLIGAYEEGRADPRIQNLLKITNYFGISVDQLVKEDFEGHGAEILAEKAGESAHFRGNRVLAITVDKEENENIQLVPQKASAGYLNGYMDPEYIGELPKFNLPNLNGSGTFRAFEINGDSMLPLESGTIIVGKYLDNLTQIASGKTYVVVTTKEGVVYKRVFNYLEDKSSLFLVSDNQQYSPYEVSADEVLEVWEAKAFISVKFPSQQTQSNPEELDLKNLSRMVMHLQEEIIKLKND
ncbi:LexA family transcriptional regulator [Persicobacter sp. CCB-QB2]|uniref:LexA family transcriptional regulator n=1 Tax=Persicobacter sp. CCB-QB2 TaxID=1561025 RepID=UPI0006A9D34E|nr:LexA family transcriptional regulator [Persicobacter sp. CCB-QB2]